MKRLYVLVLISVIVILVTSLVASCAPKSQEAIVIRISVAQPPGDPLAVNFEEMAKRINERTKGEYIAKVFVGESLVKMGESLDAVRTGAIEMISGVPYPAFAGLDPRLGELMMLFNNYGATADAALNPEFIRLYDEIFLKFNQHALAVLASDVPQLLSNKQVKTLEDWKGCLIGVPAPVAADFVTLMGGAPVVVSWTDYYSSLEKGVVDGILGGTNQMRAAKLTDVGKYVTLFDAYGVFMGHNINLDVWNAMPKRIQNIFIEETAWSSQTLADFLKSVFAKDVEDLTALGCEVYVLPAGERDRWRELTDPYLNKQLSEMGEFGQKMKEIADKVNVNNPR
jgi:TRAP-type C4-dicarboxylate transport system substrate-binding protein